MRGLKSALLFMLSGTPLLQAAPALTQFSMQQRNELGEQVLSIAFEDAGKPLLALEVPVNKFAADKWVTQGVIDLDWSSCQPAEMRNGSAKLTQCLRRSVLSLMGKDNRVSSGRLIIQILPNAVIDVAYLPNKGLKAAAVHFTATVDGQMESWGETVAKMQNLPRRALPYSNDTDNYEMTKLPVRYGKTGLSSTNILLFGDSGTGSQDQYRVGQAIESFCKSERCDFSILLGDNFYNFGVSSPTDQQWQNKFEKPYAGVNVEFRASLGNHDHLGNIQAQIDYSSRSSKWKMPARYYSFTDTDSDFFVIDSDDYDTEQNKWLESKLAASKARWKIVYGHHPVYSYGEHGDTSTLIKNMLPILKKYKVDFYIAGHDHDKQVIERDGMVFPISGASSQLRKTKSGPYTKFALSTLGFAHLILEGDQAILRYMDSSNRVEFQKVYNKPGKATIVPLN